MDHLLFFFGLRSSANPPMAKKMLLVCVCVCVCVCVRVLREITAHVCVYCVKMLLVCLCPFLLASIFLSSLPEAVLPDRMLYLPDFSHFLIVNKTSLSPAPLTLARSLPFALARTRTRSLTCSCLVPFLMNYLFYTTLTNY